VKGQTLLLKNELSLPNSKGMLGKWLLDNDLEGLLDEYAGQQIGTKLRKRAAERTIIVVDRPGFNRYKEGDKFHDFYVWNNKIYHFSKSKPKKTIVPIEAAAQIHEKRGDTEKLMARIQHECLHHPKILVTACFALSAAIRRLCEETTMLLILSGTSTTGKSATLRLVMAISESPVPIRAENVTEKRLAEHLGKRPDRATFFDELTEKMGGAAVRNFILVAANGAARDRSELFNGGKESAPVEATPIITSNRTLDELIGQKLPEELRARAFVLHVSAEAPMFEVESVPNTGPHSRETHIFAQNNYGGLWEKFLAGIEADAKKVVGKRDRNKERFSQEIAKEAGYSFDNAVSTRVLDGLAFAAYAGFVALKTNFWKIPASAIVKAFARAFGEHLQSLPPSQADLDENVLEQTRGILEHARSKFGDFDNYIGGDPQPGILGWTTRIKGKKFYLWSPGKFEELVVEKIKLDVYGALHRAGLIKVSKNKPNRFQHRIPNHPKKKRGSFVAISEEIRFVKPD
jgi:hypothetical protein